MWFNIIEIKEEDDNMKLPYKAGTRVKITSPFGFRTDPISGAPGTFHGGLDLVGLDDKTICSPVDGTVLVSQIVTDQTNRTSEWGNYVAIRDAGGIIYYFCHMARRIAVVGQNVKIGDPIGIEGSTGYSTGSHCHFEARGRDHVQLDPAELLGVPNIAGTIITVEEDNPMENKLDNVPETWSEEAVEWAGKEGILKGDEHGNLMLRANATREEIVVLLHRLYKLIKAE